MDIPFTKSVSNKYRWLNYVISPMMTWTVMVVGVIFSLLILVYVIGERQKTDTIALADINSNIGEAKVANIESNKQNELAEDRIIVKFKDSVRQDLKQKIAENNRMTEKDEIKQIGLKLFKISSEDTPEEVIGRLKKNNRDEILFAEPNLFLPPAYIPNDPQYFSQWQHPDMNNPIAWDSASGSGVTVAIADTGVNPTHPDLAGHLVPGWNFYDNNSDTSDICGHGTAVAGVEAAIGDNGNQVAGVAYNANIMPLRVVISSGTYKCYGDQWSMNKAVVYAADHGVKTINFSFGGMCGVVDSAADYMYKKGGVVVIAAGNTGGLISCSSNPQIVFVAGIDSADSRASFSSYGSFVDIATPAVSVFTTSNGGGTGGASGTSFAAPGAGGALALIWSANPNLSTEQAEQILFSTATDLGAAGWDQYYGWGKPNTGAAVALAKNTIGGQDTTPPSIPTGLNALVSDSANVNLSWNAAADNIGVKGYSIYRDGKALANVTTTTYVDSTVIGGSTYTYTVSAYDAAGNMSADSDPASVTVPFLNDQISIISYAVIAKTSTTATIVFTTSIDSVGTIKYGKKQKVLSLTNSATDNTSGKNHTVILSDLTPRTAYQYQINVQSLDGKTQASTGISSFRTMR